MPNERVIPTSASPDVCTFTLFSDGSEVSRTYHVLSISVTKELNRIPTASIVLLDGAAAAQTFEISDKEDFIPGKEIKIQAGYRGEEDVIFEGIVIRHSIKVRKNSSYLIVDCKDKAVKMTLGLKNKYFSDQKDSEVIEAIIGQYGLNKDVEATSVQHEELVQFRATDWDFILDRALANGLFCNIDNGSIQIKKPDASQDPAATLQYGSSLLELDAEMDARWEYKTVKTAAWNYTDQELSTSEAQDPNLSLNGNLSPNDLAEATDLEEFDLWYSGKLTEPELQNWADSVLLQSRWQKFAAEVVVRVTLRSNLAVWSNSMASASDFRAKLLFPASGIRLPKATGKWICKLATSRKIGCLRQTLTQQTL